MRTDEEWPDLRKWAETAWQRATIDYLFNLLFK